MKPLHRSKPKGQSLVEWALVLPVFLMVLMLIIDLGRAIFYYSEIYNSAREAARYGIIHPDDPTGITAIVRYQAVGMDLSQLNITTFNPEPRSISVSVIYRFTLLTPFASIVLGTDQLTLRTQTTMLIER